MCLLWNGSQCWIRDGTGIYKVLFLPSSIVAINFKKTLSQTHRRGPASWLYLPAARGGLGPGADELRQG